MGRDSHHGTTGREPSTLRRVPVYILAGGRSSRFGSDKARAVVQGSPLLQHAVQAAAPVASRITVVASGDGQYDDLGQRTVGDLQPHLGPMGGLIAALEDLDPPGSWLLLLPCDLLGLQPRWLELLLEGAHGPPAAAFRGTRWEPLPAIYHHDILPAARRCLAAGQRALWRLLETAGARSLELPTDWQTARRITRPRDLEPEV